MHTTILVRHHYTDIAESLNIHTHMNHIITWPYNVFGGTLSLTQSINQPDHSG